jgi:hypothetical protein
MVAKFLLVALYFQASDQSSDNAKEIEEFLGNPWVVAASFIFFLSGIVFCIKSYIKSKALNREAAEEFKKKIERIDKLQAQLRDKNDRNPHTNTN